MEICKFQETSQLLFDDLRKNVPRFVALQMHVYLDNTDLLKYIECNLEIKDLLVVHSFEKINGRQI